MKLYLLFLSLFSTLSYSVGHHLIPICTEKITYPFYFKEHQYDISPNERIIFRTLKKRPKDKAQKSKHEHIKQHSTPPKEESISK